jgi:pyridoxal phosphate enzyme (YggS family)
MRKCVFLSFTNAAKVSIAENVLNIRASIPPNITMVAVSKTQPVGAILEAYAAGQRVFGENKALEAAEKRALLPADIEWHFIGHLQTNKVKYIAPFISLIHSIDSLNLLKEVNKEAQKNGRIIDCLIQFYIATEESKFGFTPGQVNELLEAESFRALQHVRITGVMGMASFSDDTALVRREFRTLRGYFQEMKDRHFSENDSFSIISMGMSGDYTLAIEEGSTMVRIGTLLFGERNYR